MTRVGGDRRYEVRFFRYGAAILGIIPAGDLVALVETWKKDFGYDEVDAVISQALGAVFVAGKAADLKTWRAIVEEDAKRGETQGEMSPGRLMDRTSEEIRSYGDHTKENPHRYVVNVGLCDAVSSGRWNTGMLDALATWAKERIRRDVYEEKFARLEERAVELEKTPTRPLKTVRIRFSQDHYWNGRTYRHGEVLHLHPVAARILTQENVAELLKDDE